MIRWILSYFVIRENEIAVIIAIGANNIQTFGGSEHVAKGNIKNLLDSVV